MPAAAPTPVATIADGDVMARATPGVRNRSRNDMAHTGLQIRPPCLRHGALDQSTTLIAPNMPLVGVPCSEQ